MNCTWAKEKMEKEEGLNHVVVEVTPAVGEQKVEKPIAFLLVLDVSGSMNELVQGRRSDPNVLFAKKPLRPFPEMVTGEYMTKLDCVKEASEKMVDMLKDGDMLGIVSFSTIAHLEYPLTALDQQVRFGVKDRIRALTSKASTNASDGLQLAYDQIPETLKQTHHIKLMLLSDGEANHGIRDEDGITSFVRRFEDNGVSVSTIGVGESYNSFYMETIATASGGMFYHLKDMATLPALFEKEQTTLASLTMKALRVKLLAEEGLVVEGNLNGYDENGGVYRIGNVYNPLKLAFEIATIERVEKERVALTVRMEYENEKGEQCVEEKVLVMPLVDEEDIAVNEEVAQYIKVLTEAKAKKDMLRYHENGKGELLRQTVVKNRSTLRKMKEMYHVETDGIEGTLTDLEARMTSGHLQKGMVKDMYSTSYRMLRNDEEKK